MHTKSGFTHNFATLNITSLRNLARSCDVSREVIIMERIVAAAAGNTKHGTEVMNFLLQHREVTVSITENIVRVAAGNPISGKEIMDLLYG